MKLWKDMTPEEKGALLLAYHEGKVIEHTIWSVERWHEAQKGVQAPLGWHDDIAYRVKPEPVVKEVVINGGATAGVWGFDSILSPCVEDTHKITFNLVDGEPDCNSIKMFKL